MDAAEKPVLRKKLRRKQFLALFAKLEPTKIGLEACGQRITGLVSSSRWGTKSCCSHRNT
jgi:hypothetical protein